MKLFTLVADLTLDTAGFVTQVANAKSEGKSLAEAIGADSESIKASFSDAFSFAAGDLLADAVREGLRAMGEFVGESIGVASDLEETNSKIDAIFGGMSDRVHTWAKTTKEQFGIGEFAAKGYAGQLASLLSADSLELTTEQIYEMSTGLVELAGDLASFHNMSFDVVWTKLLSGMRGETEAIEDLGVDVRASAMAAYLGIATDDWGKLDQQTRTLATYDYILENTTVAQGDFVRTQDQYANQMRIFNENITQLKAQLGEGLLPVMTDLVTWFNSFFDGSEDASAGLDAIKDSATDSIVSIETTTANALALVEALQNLEATGEDASSSETWNALVSELRATLPEIGSLIDAETGKITGGTAALEAYVAQWRATSMELAQQKVVQSMYDEYAVLQAEIAKLQTEQQIADTLRSGAAKSMDEMGADLFAVMLQGMENMGASAADIKAMQAFGAEGAENLLSRIAGGGSVAAVMGALLEGGDFWKNKSFEKYFEAGGGTDAMLSNMIALYQGYQKTFEQYNIDNADEIAERQALLAGQEQEIAVLQQILAQLAANGNTVVNVTLDSDPVAAKVEQRISRNARNKSLTVAVMK